MMQISGLVGLGAPGSPAWLIFLALAFLLGGCSRSSPEVVASGETLQKTWTGENDTVAKFFGIPYAAPPVAVGDLRWRAPAAASPRAGAQESTAFAPACVQVRNESIPMLKERPGSMCNQAQPPHRKASVRTACT